MLVTVSFFRAKERAMSKIWPTGLKPEDWLPDDKISTESRKEAKDEETNLD